MSLFQLGRLTANPVTTPSIEVRAPEASPTGDRSQTAVPVQHNDAAVSSKTGNEIDEAEELLAALDRREGRKVRSRAAREELPALAASQARTPVNPSREHMPPPDGVPAPDLALVPVTSYIGGYNDRGEPIYRDRATGRLAKGGGALPGAGKGRAPGLAKMVRDIVHVPAIIQFLQDVAIGKLAAAAKMADRIKAAEIILDRGYGKPSQHVEIKDDTASSDARRQVEAMTTAQLASSVEKLRALIARKDEIVHDADIVEE